MYRMPLALFVALATVSAARADDFKIDPVHSSINFKIEHFGVSYVFGRFNEFGGEVSFDKADPSKSKFVLTIKVASIDTNVKARDDHLRNKDFFEVDKYPEAKFVSKDVKAVDGSWLVTGDFTMHGVTKPVAFALKGGKSAENKGQIRIGFFTEFTLRRTDFGMNTMVGPVGDEVMVAIAFEAVKGK
jgi:polyisoprenoid-binding protein YceI